MYVTFQDLRVESSWRQRHAIMTPLFAMTQASQSQSMSDDSVDGGVRATQDVQQFTATQDLGKTISLFNKYIPSFIIQSLMY